VNTRPSSRTIKRLYLDEGLSRTAIARRLHIPSSFVTKSLSQSGVDMRPQITPTIVSELVKSRPHRPHIVMDKGQPILKCQIRLTLELAYTLGWIVGDGYANKREIDAIVSLRERSLIESFVTRELERFGTVFVVPRSSVLLVRCNSTMLSRILCSPRGTWYWENVDFVLHSRKYASAFIAGFWDADGGIYRETNGTVRTHLYNSDLLLLNKIAHALQSLYGIETRIYKRKKNKDDPSSKIHQRLDRFDLYVRSKSNDRWGRYIARFMLLPWKKPVAVERP
jgi:LAGLIDADG-like domain